MPCESGPAIPILSARPGPASASTSRCSPRTRPRSNCACSTRPTRRKNQRAHHAARADRHGLARLPARRPAEPALRLPRPRPVRTAAGPPLQPEQGCHGSIREVGGAYDSMGRRDVRLSRRRSATPTCRSTTRDNAAVRAAGRRRRSGVHLGRRSAAAHAVAQHGHLRDARPRLLEAASRAFPNASARHLRSADHGAGDRPSQEAGRDRRRADAGAPPRARSASRGKGADELLGLQQLRLLRARAAVRGVAHAGRRGPRVQADGARAPRRRPRSDPRRRLQPHRRRQSSRADAVAQGDRQRVVLPARRATTRATTWTSPAAATR